jgi:hypothetical protein
MLVGNYLTEYISYIFVFLLIIASILPWNKISKGSKNNPRKTFNGKAVGGISLIKAVKEKTFWGFFFIFCFTAVGIFGISLHVVAYLVYVGLSEVQAAFSFWYCRNAQFCRHGLNWFSS